MVIPCGVSAFMLTRRSSSDWCGAYECSHLCNSAKSHERAERASKLPSVTRDRQALVYRDGALALKPAPGRRPERGLDA
jgi:hypothetical protein